MSIVDIGTPDRDFLDALDQLGKKYRTAASNLRDEDIMEFRRAMRALQRTLSPVVYALEMRARAMCGIHKTKRALYLYNGQIYCTPCAFALAAKLETIDRRQEEWLMAWWHAFHSTEPGR